MLRSCNRESGWEIHLAHRSNGFGVLAPVLLARDLLRLHRDRGVPPIQALRDFVSLRRRIRISRRDFLWYRLHDRSRPLAERLTYLSSADRYRIEYLMNPRRESRGLLDKTRVAAALEQAGVPTPRTLGVYAPPGSSYTHGPRVQTIEDLRGMLAGHLPSGIVCKPNGGFSGNDVYVFRTASPEGLIHLDGTAWSVEALFARLSRAGRAASPEDREGIWKIEARVAQHPELTSAVGQTLATVRVVTYARADGGVHLLPPVWKVPISDCGVDNLAYSRWLAPVGLDSGRVGPLVHRDNQARRVDHPTTGAMIEGLILPGWDEVAGLVRRATSQFPALRSLGCDVGLTADGPVIIEVNPWWGVEMIQAPRDRGIVHGEFADFLEEIGAGSVVAGREA